MPAWGKPGDEKDEASWALVAFIRHLPQLTKDELFEMETQNPKSPQEVQEQEEDEKFLNGDEPEPASPHTSHMKGNR
jgi:hypothetical protein